MKTRCGSKDPAHVSRRCRACKSIYNRRYRLAHKVDAPRRPRLELNPAVCALCNLARGNSLGIPVYRYSLHRTAYINGGKTKKTVHLAVLPLCDECIVEHATPAPTYARLARLDGREWPKRERRAA